MLTDRYCERKFIMKKQDILRCVNVELDSLDECKVVGYCRINNNYYPIVEIANGLDNLAISTKFFIFCKLKSQLYQFEMNGQTLAIVEAENSLNSSSDIVSLLTERELQIVTFVAQGNSNKQIASHLRISEWTVSTHLRRIFVKLGVDSRAAMVYRCAELLYQL